MAIESKRKEVSLPQAVIDRLQMLADKKQWSLKKYMEWALGKESDKVSKTKSHERI